MTLPTPPRKELARAIHENDVARVQQLCDNALVPTFSDKERCFHTLSKAIGQSVDIAILQILIDAGVDPHALPEKHYPSPIQAAVFYRRPDCLRFLLDLGVDPSVESEERRIALSPVGPEVPVPLQLEMLELLVEHGVDINFQFTVFGDKNALFTVLDHATHDEVKEYLRSVGAKTSAELSGKEPAPRASLGNEHLDEVRAYMESEFGVAEDRSFRNIVTASPGIAVHVIKPTSPEDPITLFTTGMSAQPMKVPAELAEHAWAEFYMQLPGDWDVWASDPQYAWPIQLLLDLAGYPEESGGFFAVPVTTLSNGEPAEPLGPNVKFTATALIADKRFDRSDGQTVHLFCVVAAYAEEVEMARRSIPDLLNALDAADTGRVLSVDRPSVATQ